MGCCVSRVPEDPSESELYRDTGLYPRCLWSEEMVYNLVKQKKIAPRRYGMDQRSQQFPEECPICMLYHPYLNRLCCCQQSLCTECFLQVCVPGGQRRFCPFCKAPGIHVKFSGPRSSDELSRLSAEREEIQIALARAKENAANLSIQHEELTNEDDEETRTGARSTAALTTTTTTSAPSAVPAETAATVTESGRTESREWPRLRENVLPVSSPRIPQLGSTALAPLFANTEYEARLIAREMIERDREQYSTSENDEDGLILEEMFLAEAIRRSLQAR